MKFNISRPLVTDLTHGGVTIALEMRKHFPDVMAWDFYGTLGDDDREMLIEKGVDVVEGPVNGSTVIAPVHCPVRSDLTHHEITGWLLGSWRRKRGVPVVEVTGVKGKTSTVWILRSIMGDLEPLVLSSLGSWAGDELLRRDISIAPASIIETVNLAEHHDYGAAIFEVSLGGTGLADVGVLTNIAEDYGIRRGTSRASRAKEQIFRSRLVCCEYRAFWRHYSRFQERTNTFSVRDAEATLHVDDVNYGLESTEATLHATGLKTLVGDRLDAEFRIETFAPAEHQLSNVLAAASAALTLGFDVEDVQRGVKDYHGIPGRTSMRQLKGTTIIEEINPGLNVRAIDYTLKMAMELPDPIVIFGGRYGVTCEEIDEARLSEILSNYDLKFIFTDELGYSIMRRSGMDGIYFKNPEDALRVGLNHRTVVLIYRSEYGDLTKR